MFYKYIQQVLFELDLSVPPHSRYGVHTTILYNIVTFLTFVSHQIWIQSKFQPIIMYYSKEMNDFWHCCVHNSPTGLMRIAFIHIHP